VTLTVSDFIKRLKSNKTITNDKYVEKCDPRDTYIITIPGKNRNIFFVSRLVQIVNKFDTPLALSRITVETRNEI